MALSSLITVAFFLASTSFAADCASDQPRKAGDPSGSQIAQAISVPTELKSICSGNWRTGDDKKLENSFNHWSVTYKVSRTDNTQDLRYCNDAFQNIIEQCITNGNFWGGSWSLNGETYSISNSVFPNNPLAPSDDGGPKDTTPGPSKTSPTGPITSAPQSSTVATGQWSTTTQSIDGLTADSATTTTRDGHTTILPIWFVGPGVGIIVIPFVGAPVGGIVPPPPGHPTLTIGEDGKPTTTKKDDQTTTKSTTSSAPVSSSSAGCSSCKSCNLKSVSISIDENTLGELSGNIPVIIPGGTTPSGSNATPTPQASSSTTSTEPLQSAVPIDSPACAFSGIDSKNIIPDTLDGTNGSLQDLLFKLREEACSRSCSTAGPGIPGKAVSTLNDNGQCEIRVALTANIEAYLYRATPSTGDQQQQCWDSFENILNKCVKNGPNKGWWNGNHVYQFYEAGVRPLNDGTAKDNFKLTEWLGASTVGLTCGKDCVGFIPNPQWCNSNCFHQKRHSEPISTTFTKRRNKVPDLRSRATELKKVNCGITYTLPDYPSTAKENNPRNNDAGSITAITDNGWWDYTDDLFVPAPDLCYRTLRKTTDRQPNKEYATEHIYEKHIVKMFINWLSYDMTEDNGGFAAGKIATCDTMKNVFNKKSTDPNSKFKDITPAQALANTMSCSGTGCPATDRLSEFYILEENVNKLKENVLGEMRKDADFKYLTCNYADWRDNLGKLSLMSAVFQYLSKPEVAAVWVKVHNRMRGVLADLDADASYANYKPGPLKVPGNLQVSHNGWMGAYDYFMDMFMVAAQEKTRQYAFKCVDTILEQIENDGTLTDDDAKKRGKDALSKHRKEGMWSDNVLQFGAGYKDLMTMEWS